MERRGHERRSNPAEIPPELRDVVMVLDGVLYVAGQSAINPQVLSFESRLKRSGSITGTRRVSLERMGEMRRNAPGDKGLSLEKATEVQEAAIGIFRTAVKSRASDVHIRVYPTHAKLLFRIHGDLEDQGELIKANAIAICGAIYGSMADVSDRYYNPTVNQDARIAKPEMLPDGLHGIRVASGPHAGGSYMVLRLLYEDKFTVPEGQSVLGVLGYSAFHVKSIEFMKRRPTGINIVAGPTGSGKSTTLKAIMESVHTEFPGLNILTVEDPPEYPITGALQKPVTNADTEDERRIAFAGAIRSAMREDPDVIMVGEMRDRQSAHLALEAAMTGHRVWTTLHANSAFDIVRRYADMLSGPQMPNPIDYLASPTIMTGLVFQRLVKALCPHCKLPLAKHLDRLPDGVFDRVSRLADLRSDPIAVRGDGCVHCASTGRNRGISGRIAVSEVVSPDPTMLEKLRTDGVDAAQQYWRQVQGGVTCLEYAIEKVREGLVDPVDAESVMGPLTTEMVMADRIMSKDEMDAVTGR